MDFGENMCYRIDFSRLARTEDEIAKDMASKKFLGVLLSGRSKEVHQSFINSLPDGHILDSKTIEDSRDLSGLEVLGEFISPIYPEAKMLSWDRF